MRDPMEMIQFFKSKVYLDIEEAYLDVLEQLNILKENHVFAKGALNAPSKLFCKISTELTSTLAGLQVSKPEKEAFVEVILYERVGNLLLGRLGKLYHVEDLAFQSKCLRLFAQI